MCHKFSSDRKQCSSLFAAPLLVVIGTALLGLLCCDRNYLLGHHNEPLQTDRKLSGPLLLPIKVWLGNLPG